MKLTLCETQVAEVYIAKHKRHLQQFIAEFVEEHNVGVSTHDFYGHWCDGNSEPGTMLKLIRYPKPKSKCMPISEFRDIAVTLQHKLSKCFNETSMLVLGAETWLCEL